MKRNKLGLVLGGGGAKGSYQIGVFKALMDAKIFKHITHVSGTSIGAINAIMVMSKMSYEEMIAIWESLDNDAIYKSGYSARHLLNRQGIFNTDAIFSKIVPLVDKKQLQKSKIQGYAVLAKVPDEGILNQFKRDQYESEVVHLNKVVDPFKIVAASAAIPFVFGSKEIDGVRYVDGGVVDGVPIQTLVDQGCDTIITIALNTKFSPYDYPPNITIIDLTPEFSLGRFPMATLNFAHEKMLERVELGYENGKRMVTYLRTNKYINWRGRLKIKPHHVIRLNLLPATKKAHK